ncbi:prepilin-type N-terminal cleavage/methylation domain-containing protein [Candidatus Saccharibacteria bacterium]|nr:prepilin-type N-terminal cleavage/methylation domain-containing protein [Candidatus Saccharibacteria bacterium]
MLKTLTKNRKAGFTIVELLIVIVVIGILAAIVLNTFSGVQARARNTERQTDIKGLSSQLEAFAVDPANANPGNYPLGSSLVGATPAAVQLVLKGIDANAIQAPGGNANSLITGTSPTTSQYGYNPYIAGGTTPCAAANNCGKFVLNWNEEAVNGSGGGQKTKDSLNQ